MHIIIYLYQLTACTLTVIDVAKYTTGKCNKHHTNNIHMLTSIQTHTTIYNTCHKVIRAEI